MTTAPTAVRPRFPDPPLAYDPSYMRRLLSAIEATVQQSSAAGGDVPSTRKVIAGTGLTGGGDLSQDRTLALNPVMAVSSLSATGAVSAASLSITLGAITSGTYTPTLSNTTNVGSSTALVCQYMRVGSVVTVSGGVTLTATAGASLTTMGITIPIASTFAAVSDLGGAASAAGISATAALFADTSNNRATFQMISPGTSSETYYFTFSYLVI